MSKTSDCTCPECAHRDARHDATMAALRPSMRAGRALTPEQKRAAVERIFAAWQAKSDLRLGQLIYHALQSEAPTAWLQNVDDAEIVAIVEAFAKRKERRAGVL